MYRRLAKRCLNPKSRFHSVSNVKRLRRRSFETRLCALEKLEDRRLLATILIPQDQPTIQAGIDAAQDGDVVLVAPGVYTEQLTMQNKPVTLASQFYSTGDPSFIEQTIIDGGNSTVITVLPSVGVGSQIIGFTIRNGSDGINADGFVDILNNRFSDHSDAIDFESGGGIVRNNIFEDCSDDAVDLDGPTAAVIENNLILDMNDDGIEIRLHANSGPTLNIVIRNNQIYGSAQDGIQLIDQSGTSDRFFIIENNLIQGSGSAGLGLMDGGDTLEDFRAASITDPIHLLNNTFVDNPYAVSGGDSMVALNNLFVNSSTLALKNVDGNSIASHNLFWNNGVDQIGSNVDVATSVFADPLLATDFQLQAGSPAIDAGTAFFEWNGVVVLDRPATTYSGTAPDLGKFESVNNASLYFAYSTAATLPGNLQVENEDIVAFDGSIYSMYFDGSDLGLDSSRIDAIKVIDNDEILMSFTAGVSLPGISGTVDDSDIVKFTASQLGTTTAGTFEMFFDGSDVGLETSTEDVDAIELLADGRVLISTSGDFNVAQLFGQNEDIIAFTPTSLGDTTAGSWSLYFDGSDVGLSGSGVDGIEVDGSGAIYLTTDGSFVVPGLSGKDEDVFVFYPTSLGDTTAGTYDPTFLFDGSLFGAGMDVKAIDIPRATATVTVEDVTVAEGGALLFTATLDKAVSSPFDVTVSFADVSATGGAVSLVSPEDYANDEVTLSFAGTAGETQQFTVATLDDAAVEGSETFMVNLSASNTLVNADDTAIGTITDNDAQANIFETRVSASFDDAEERLNSGGIDILSGDLDMVFDTLGSQQNQLVGMRFTGVSVPQGATIQSAYIQFQADEASTAATSLTIQGEDVDDALTFSTANSNISSRPTTSSAVSWSPAAWNTVGDAGSDQQTPNIASVIQEIVNRPGWSSGNALAITINGTGERVAESFDGNAAAAPLLHVEFDTASPGVTTSGTIDTAEGSLNDSYIVVLESIPTANVDITVTPDSQTDLGAGAGLPVVLTFTPGNALTPQDVNVTAVDDAVVEGLHTSTITHAATSTDANYNNISINDVVGSIADNDTAAVTVQDVTVVEGGGALFTVTVDNAVASGFDVTVDFTDISATGGALDLISPEDYANDTVTLNFAGNAGETQQFSVPTLDDSTVEGSETFAVNLSATNVLVDASDTAIGTITDNDGQASVFQTRILASSDDAEERSNTSTVSLASADLDIVFDSSGSQQEHLVGLRFTGINVPRGATIQNAYIQFQADEASSVATSLTVQGEAVDNALTFAAIDGDISSRTTTSSSVSWSPAAWNTVGEAGPDQQTPNIASVIQEIVNRSGWSSGNALAITISGTGERVAVAFDENADAAPLLHVEFDVPSSSPVLVGAGDIAGSHDEDEATAQLLDNIAGTVFTLGDNVYSDGSAQEFNDYYDPTWGRHKARTTPVVGNHDYDTPGATGYFDYFGAAAGDPDKGYYSYDLGDWHIVALNTECSEIGGCDANSPQGLWLQADLAANPSACTLAFTHKARFSSGQHGMSSSPEGLWQILYDAGADVVLSGHDHNYERFAPQTPDGVADPLNGIRQFVVGTGGTSLRPIETILPNSEVRNDETHGVLKLTLNPSSYEWEFVPIAGQTFTDSGIAACSPRNDVTSPVLVAAGDIAGSHDNDEATAQLLDNIPGTVAPLGNNAFWNGTPQQYNDFYDPTWGRHKDRTLPIPGNHDYDTPGAAGYFDYFGEAAGDPDKGYYSYDLGDWHIVALNSKCNRIGGCDTNSPEAQWLQADLAANPSACTLAYVHNPRFSSGFYGSSDSTEDFWQILYDAGADVVISGHDTDYERFAPQTPTGVADPLNGIRQFVVGTGGSPLRPFETIEPNSEVRNSDTHGVLKLTLNATSYEWEFVPVAGQTFTDSGSAGCSVPSGNRAPTVTAGPDQTITLPASAVLDGTVWDDGLPDPPAVLDSTWSKVSGPGTVTFADAGAVDTTVDFSSAGTYVLRLTTDDGEQKAGDEVTVIVDPDPTAPATILYVSVTSTATLPGGVVLENEDIHAFNGVDFNVVFDGSDVGLGGANVDAFAVISADEILLSFRSAETVPGIAGTVADSDIVKFTATQLGGTTIGVFEMFLRGSDVGLAPVLEDIDAIDLHDDGRLIISTIGGFDVIGLTGADEDLIAFTPFVPGDYSAGTWEMYFDGSDVELAGEDVNAVGLDANGDIYLAATNAFAVTGVAGDDEDVFAFVPSQLGPDTSGGYLSTLLFDGSQFGLSVNDVNGIDIPTTANSGATGDALQLIQSESETLLIARERDASRHDVSRDGVVTALDALQLINSLSVFNAGTLHDGQIDEMDVNDDGILSALDALLVVNYLSRAVAPQGESVVLAAPTIDGPVVQRTADIAQYSHTTFLPDVSRQLFQEPITQESDSDAWRSRAIQELIDETQIAVDLDDAIAADIMANMGESGGLLDTRL